MAIKDEEQCAYSLGWEWARRGWHLASLPDHIVLNEWKHQDFLAGYRDFRPKSESPEIKFSPGKKKKKNKS